MDWTAIVAAGLAGTLALTAVMLVGAAVEARVSFPVLLGTFFASPGPPALLVGLVWHFVNGVVFAAVYAFAFSFAAIEPSLVSGAALGLVHAVVAGILLGVLAAVHPRIRQGHMPSPGLFALRYGIAGIAFLLAAHLAFGAIVGLIL